MENVYYWIETYNGEQGSKKESLGEIIFKKIFKKLNENPSKCLPK